VNDGGSIIVEGELYSVHPTFPWGKRYAMISLIDEPLQPGRPNERHGTVPESAGDCVPVER